MSSVVEMVKDEFIRKNMKIITESIDAFLTSETHFDYEMYMKSKPKTLKDVVQAAIFVYKYMGKEKYLHFMEKALPFEPYFDGSNIEEKEKFKQNVAKVVDNIRLKKANLIDILDSGVTNLYQYCAMVRQLVYKYKAVPVGAYLSNLEYARSVLLYDREGQGGTVEYGEEDEANVAKILESRSLKVNAITKGAAYRYAKRCYSNEFIRK